MILMVQMWCDRNVFMQIQHNSKRGNVIEREKFLLYPHNCTVQWKSH